MKEYKYGSNEPVKVNLSELSAIEQRLLTESKTFCIYPWVHLHVSPHGQAYPCCMSDFSKPVGDCKTSTMQQVWNNTAQKQLRVNMLSGVKSPECSKCYEQEANGFFSGRQSANKHHGHHVTRVHETGADGHLEKFEMTYWDIRFSNLCNLRCRSCGPVFSSQWHADQVKLYGPDSAPPSPLLVAGRTETDMLEQLLPHLDYVEHIYFAGGEPLIMEEHYIILDELVKRKRFNVSLAYNTNFTRTQFKGKSVFEYWKKFKQVSVGASLDAMGSRAEYIRKGTVWADIERNRAAMIATCPDVDFYISATLSILNALHLPDFHAEWVNKGFIDPAAFNVNILQSPEFYRVDIATAEYKQRILERYQQHINWLQPHDKLTRATIGFESAVNFMLANDNSSLLMEFWKRTAALDSVRNESLLTALPELAAIQINNG